MSEKRFVIRLSVQCGGLDIGTIRAVVVSDNLERPAVLLMNRHTLKQRTADDVIVHARRNRIKAHGAEHIPGRHLSGIVISGKPVRVVGILRVKNFPDALLRLPRRAGIVVEIGDVMTRFVAVPVLSDPADAAVVVSGKIGLQIGFEIFIPAH